MCADDITNVVALTPNPLLLTTFRFNDVKASAQEHVNKLNELMEDMQRLSVKVKAVMTDNCTTMKATQEMFMKKYASEGCNAKPGCGPHSAQLVAKDVLNGPFRAVGEKSRKVQDRVSNTKVRQFVKVRAASSGVLKAFKDGSVRMWVPGIGRTRWNSAYDLLQWQLKMKVILKDVVNDIEAAEYVQNDMAEIVRDRAF